MPGVLADAQRAGRCALLHPGGHVHGHTHRSVVGVDAGAQRHVAGVHAHAHGEVGHAVQALHDFGLRAPGLTDGQAGPHRPLGIVLAHLVHAEGGLDPIARESQHPALSGFDDVSHALHRAVQDRQRVFGGQAVGHRSGTDHVCEQHSDLAMSQPGGLQLAF